MAPGMTGPSETDIDPLGLGATVEYVPYMQHQIDRHVDIPY